MTDLTLQGKQLTTPYGKPGTTPRMLVHPESSAAYAKHRAAQEANAAKAKQAQSCIPDIRECDRRVAERNELAIKNCGQPWSRVAHLFLAEGHTVADDIEVLSRT